MSKKKEERQKKIREILDDQGEMKVSELAKQMEVTPETIRKDLDELETQEIIVREHGKARINRVLSELPVEIRKQDFPNEKKRISYRAISMIHDGDIIFMDGGTTILSGIELLRSKKDLTIVTISLPLATACLELGFSVYLLGGQIKKNTQYTSGVLCREGLKHFHFDICFLGSSGVRGLNGFSGCYSLEEAVFFNEVLERTDKAVIVMTSNKLNYRGNYPYLLFRDTDLLITNRLSDDERKQLSEIKQIIEV